MKLGNLLVAKGLVSTADINRAMEHNLANGGRLGDSIIALGLLTKEQIEKVLADAPQSPITISDTGIDAALLFELVIKGMYGENLETASAIAESLKLSSSIVNNLLQDGKDRKLIESLASSVGTGSMAEMRLTLTRAGREFAVDAVSRGQYFGPAPVSLADYQDRLDKFREIYLGVALYNSDQHLIRISNHRSPTLQTRCGSSDDLKCNGVKKNILDSLVLSDRFFPKFSKHPDIVINFLDGNKPYTVRILRGVKE